jgi:metal-responsive CopG/Arc/MetJ family transcriptional regulator
MATTLIPLATRVELPLRERVDDWRRRQPNIPARSEALRELLRRALQAEDRQHKREHPA